MPPSKYRNAGRKKGSYNKTLPSKSGLTNRLASTRSIEDRDLLVTTHLEKIPDEYLESLPEPISFTDITTLFNSDYHALIEGKTGSGKTTLLLTLVKRFLEKRRIVLLRDDGGKEFRFLSCYYPTRIFVPDEETVTCEPLGFKADIVRFKKPQEIIKQVYDYSYPLNVILYDVYCVTRKQQARFYSGLFMSLINTLQKMRDSKKRKLVFAIDELNDLIPPRGKGTPITNITRADIELNIRKIRKHKVQMIASSHRFNQIGIDTRSQMEQIYFKKSYGYDVWNFLSKNLITSNNKTFWGMVKRLLTLPRNQFVMFDENRKFDLYTFPDIPRPNIEIDVRGSIPIKDKNKTVTETTLLETYAYGKLIEHGMKHGEAAQMIGKDPHVMSALMSKLKYSPNMPTKCRQALQTIQ